MIRPLFTGTTPWYAVVALMLAAAIFTVWVYKKHPLPKPWSRILPAVRILALWLIALMLLAAGDRRLPLQTRSAA